MKFICSVLFLFYTITGIAQDVHFSQFYESNMLLNPALMGIYNGEYRLVALYRSQWNSISSPFQTATASLDIKRKLGESQDFIDFGLMGYYDKTGSIDLATLSGNLSVSYYKILNEDKNTILSFGIVGGYLQRSFDRTKVTLGNQYNSAIGGYDPSLPTSENFTNNMFSQMDLGLGVNFATDMDEDNLVNYSFGLAGYHLTKPENNFFATGIGLRQDFRWNINLATNRLLNEYLSLQIKSNIMIQGKYRNILIGGMLGKKLESVADGNEIIFYCGMYYRLQDAFIPIVKLNYNDFTVAVSYDLNASKLRAASNFRGGFEISLRKQGILTDPNKGFSTTICPKR